MKTEEQLKNMRHSGAHLLAAAVTHLYPGVKLAIGPAIDSGFYYDFDFGETKISEKDFPKIEKEMNRLKKQGLKFEKVEMSIDEAKKFLKENSQPYSLSLLEDIEQFGSTVKGEQDTKKKKQNSDIVTFFKNGDFMNLCRGGHVDSFAEVGAFTLTSIAGAYFRGSEKNPMLTRIYAACFETQEELEMYLQMQEEAKRRDHRILGPALGIFMFSDEVGSGLPLLLPNGETLKHILMEYMRKEEEKRGYVYVSTPVIAHEELYKRSGHAQYYHDDMYNFTDKEGTRFYIKPMNCPHHHMIFEKLIRSYRDLPIRLAEAGAVYRNELSGTLTGLIRVRGPITQNDSHIYVRPSQLSEEFYAVLDLFRSVYEKMGIKGYWFRLSLPDFDNGSEKYGGDKKKWEVASEAIRNSLKNFEKDWNVHFVEAEGEAAFYGPKLDIQIRNVTGKEDTIATSQVDILVPERMDITYINEKGEKEYPIIIHRAILGSYERFIGFMIEQSGGEFPFWMAPVQIGIIPVNDEYVAYAMQIADELRKHGLRVHVDKSAESVSKKIRNAALQKIPAKIVIGEKEFAKSKEMMMSVNWRKDLEGQSGELLAISQLIEIFSKLSEAEN